MRIVHQCIIPPKDKKKNRSPLVITLAGIEPERAFLPVTPQCYNSPAIAQRHRGTSSINLHAQEETKVKTLESRIIRILRGL